ncbi:LysM peptidoglycan-binding domain-containing protein [candidate division KSB1 bacterium]|nr:LysM peptidoglycan-binding domain-containing protein [candidate division KSB1 bacterium]
MLTDLIAKMFKMFLMAVFIGFILSFVLMALIYFVAHKPAPDLYGPTEMPKLRPNSLINSAVTVFEPKVMNADYRLLDRTSGWNGNLQLNKYYVQDGENLTDICSRFNVSVEVVRQANQLEAWHTIAPGTFLHIPLN